MPTYRYDDLDTFELYKPQLNHRLLTRDEEYRLTSLYQHARRLARSPRRHQPAFALYVQSRIDAGLSARDELVRCNQRLVLSMAKKYIGRGVPLADLVQEGNLGLLRGLELFDPASGNKLSTYVTWWIWQALSRLIADTSRTIRLPVHLHDKLHKLYYATERIRNDAGRDPTDAELAAALETTPAKVQAYREYARITQTASLDAPLDDDNDATYYTFLANDADVAGDAVRSDMRERLHEILETLTPRESQIIKLRYGLTDGHTYTLEEIGQRYGLTRERIRQLEQRALRKLRHPVRSRKMVAFLE